MADIARLAGVSKNTVSLALRQDRQIPAATRTRIARIAEKIGYRKNSTVARLMAELRRSDSPCYKSSIALLNANADKTAFRSHPTIPTYVEGCQRRAVALGYRLDEFWLHDPALDGNRLNKILTARGILGVIVVGLMRSQYLPPRFLPTWSAFPTVVTGVRTRDPSLSFACTDHYFLAKQAVQKALELGYSRPALVISSDIDELVDNRFSAGVHVAQQVIPARNRIAPLLIPDTLPGSEAVFFNWLEKKHPDVLLVLYNSIRRWIENRGLRVPGDLGLIQLEWRSSSPDWSGMNQHNDIVGEAAVEMVVGMIHSNEAGVPLFPRATLIGSSWIHGKTALDKRTP